MRQARATGQRRAAGAGIVRFGACAVIFVITCCCAGQGFAQAPTDRTPTGPARFTGIEPVDSATTPIPGTSSPWTAESPPSSPLPGSLVGGESHATHGPAESGKALEGAPNLEARGDIPVPSPRPPKGRFRLETSWNNGLRFESDDEWFHIHVGGNAQIDCAWLIGPKGVFAIPGGGTNGLENASAILLRRARLRAEGDIFDQFDYVLEYDLANANNENEGLQPASFGNLANSPAPCNVWMQIREVPYLGNVRFGNQVKPIGMTNNTYQGALPFLERADTNDAFYGPFDSGFALGLSARNWSETERMTWQYGIY